MKIAWLTDIHLNFLDQHEREIFYQEIINRDPDTLLVTGDIAERKSIVKILTEMADIIQKPIYFVLGNHDYYGSSVSEVKKSVTQLCSNSKSLHWLNISSTHHIADDTILLGQDSWADGRYGDYQNSCVSLNDSRLIAELFQARILGKNELLRAMQSLADSDADRLNEKLTQATNKKPKQIITAIHVPPFRESAMYEGKISNDDFLPFFTSKVTGDVLLDAAKKNPSIEFLVLCGHSHSRAYHQPLPNLTVKSGGAEYHQPEIQEVIKI